MINDIIRPWEELSREMVFKKYGRMIEKVVYRLPDGKETDFYIKKEGPAVAILALTKGTNVILVNQFRPGPNEVLRELPGGYVEEKETPFVAAERELLEETGYKGEIKWSKEVYDCAYSTMRRHCVIITNCNKVVEPKQDTYEKTKVEIVSLDEFITILRSGKMTDIEAGYLCLDHLHLIGD